MTSKIDFRMALNIFKSICWNYIDYKSFPNSDVATLKSPKFSKILLPQIECEIKSLFILHVSCQLFRFLGSKNILTKITVKPAINHVCIDLSTNIFDSYNRRQSLNDNRNKYHGLNDFTFFHLNPLFCLLMHDDACQWHETFFNGANWVSCNKRKGLWASWLKWENGGMKI